MRASVQQLCWSAAAMVVAGAVQAQTWQQMDSIDRIRSGLEAFAPQVHLLPPAKVVRPLPPAAAGTAPAELVAAAESETRGRIGSVLVDKGVLVHERYAPGAGPGTLMNAYSVTKSWTALAVGEAWCAGKIKSLDDQAQVYAPQLEGTAYGRASVRQLLQYASGAEDPGGNGYVGIHDRGAFNDMVLHRLSLADLARQHGASSRWKPGEKFTYNGLDSESLSLVVRGATGMSLPAWFEATVWQAAGGEFPAAWFLDKDGNGIAEVLLFASTRDFARVGLYVLERLAGQAGSECSQAFVKEAAQPLMAKAYWQPAPAWGLGLHHGADGQTWMFGFNGQRIGVHLAKQRVLAVNNFGESRGEDFALQRMLGR